MRTPIFDPRFRKSVKFYVKIHGHTMRSEGYTEVKLNKWWILSFFLLRQDPSWTRPVKARVMCESDQLRQEWCVSPTRQISFELVSLGEIFNFTKRWFITNVKIVALQQFGNVPICYKQLKPHSGTFPAVLVLFLELFSLVNHLNF